MKKLISYGKILGFVVIYMILVSLIMGLIYYFGNFNYKTISNIILGMVLILFFLLGYNNGKKSKNKGYLAGLKIGSIFILLLLFINLIFYRNFKLTLLFYYILLIMSSILGGMIGINRKKD